MVVPYALDRQPRAAAAPVELDEHQQRVADHRTGPLLVLAGPGTGKTTTIVESVARRVEAGEDPASFLLLTFSRKAAAELRERLALRLPAAAGAVSATTFHSLALRLVTETTRQPGDPALRLLSAAEQEWRVRELLTGRVGRDWPEALVPALGTRGLAKEVRAFVGGVLSQDLDPAEVREWARQQGWATWEALADFTGEYLDVLTLAGEIDYSGLIARAVDVARDATAAWTTVVVDEFQDTDPAQVALLVALTGCTGLPGSWTLPPGRALVAVGDPDQAIYSFRGADVRGIERFRHTFAGAEVVALQACRRSVPVLVALSRAVVGSLPTISREHRQLTARPGDGSVDVRVFPTASAEGAGIATALRREHFAGVGWSDMAVLVRSARRDVPRLRRALEDAGIPVQVAGDEVPLARDPAVGALLLGLQAAADPGALDLEQVVDLMAGPLGVGDAVQLRRTLRALRRRRAAGADVALAPPGPDLLKELVEQLVTGDDGALVDLETRIAGPLARVAARLRAARTALGTDVARQAVDVALWTLWSGTPWSAALVERSDAGGRSGEAADRVLDAVVALFEVVADIADTRGGAVDVRTVVAELEAYEIPTHPDLADRPTASGVHIMTAHRSKGLEWEVVVAAGVQARVWPDLRLRGSLLDAGSLESDERGEPQRQEPATATQLLAEERRLFYVAVTRARRALLVTAVAANAEEEPSAFVREVWQHLHPDAGDPAPVPREPERLDLPTVVGRLRRLASGDDPVLADAAARRLRELALVTDDADLPLVPAADPAAWWGVLPETRPDSPATEDDIVLSPSTVEALITCPLRWFLERRVRAQVPQSKASGFGSVVHALAEALTTDDAPTDHAGRVALLGQHLDTVWSHLGHETPWAERAEREMARELLERLVGWHERPTAREVLGVEQPVSARLEVDGHDVVLQGRIDRLEVDDEGRSVVVDFKTSTTDETHPETHAQLALYQLALSEGGHESAPREVGGGELVMLRFDPLTKQDPADSAKVRRQEPLPTLELDPRELLTSAVEIVLDGTFEARPNVHCDRCAQRRMCPSRPEGVEVPL